jgi:hypothetical protein
MMAGIGIGFGIAIDGLDLMAPEFRPFTHGI